jgi:tryptophan aminotransferase
MSSPAVVSVSGMDIENIFMHNYAGFQKPPRKLLYTLSIRHRKSATPEPQYAPTWLQRREIDEMAVRSLFPLEATPGVLSLLAGKPNPTTFPFTSFSFTAQSPPTEDGHAASEDINLSLSGPELAAGLQYGPTGGMAPLVDWLYDLQRTVHGRERGEGWGLSVGSGSQDLLSKVGVADFEGPPPDVDRPSLRC